MFGRQAFEFVKEIGCIALSEVMSVPVAYRRKLFVNYHAVSPEAVAAFRAKHRKAMTVEEFLTQLWQRRLYDDFADQLRRRVEETQRKHPGAVILVEEQ